MKIGFVANQSFPGSLMIMARTPVEVAVLRQFIDDQRPLSLRLLEPQQGSTPDTGVTILLQHVGPSVPPPSE